MNTADVLAAFKAAGALLEGHFILTTGRRSPVFLQKAFVFADPVTTERLCAALAQKITAAFGRIDVVVAPAVGAIVPGYETARALGCRSIYVERVDGVFQLRRGFAIQPGERVLVVEDIITTGVSVRETLDAIRSEPGEIVGAAVLINRSGGAADVGVPLVALADVDFPSYAADEIPPDLAAIPPVKPGSRGLA
jgi:orotate phosphoribosyltransferase